MKLCKKLFFVIALALLLILPVSCIQEGTHVHVYGEWKMTSEPTQNDPGKATRVCKCGHEMKMSVAPLSDQTIWTAETKVEATCATKGEVVYTSKFGEVVVIIEKGEHQFGEWVLTVEPTQTVPGKITRTCVYGDKEEKEVPVLTDESVWTVSELTEATCLTEGKAVYTSVYGTVTVVLEKLEHTYGNWELTVEPTLKQTGNATRTCTGGHSEEVVVPALTDESVWTVTKVNEPTFTEDGSTIYSSIYGEVSVAIEKLIPPYINQQYRAFELESKYAFGKVVPRAMSNVNIEFDENGTTVAKSAYPFSSIVTVSIVDANAGTICFTDERGVKSYGYLDAETGVMVRSWGSSYSDTIVLVPTSSAVDLSNVVATSWNNALAFEYNDGNIVCSAFIYNEVAYFGVSFEDSLGNQLTAGDCAVSKSVYVKNSKGEIIEAFVKGYIEDQSGKLQENLVVTDRLDGTYTQGDNTLVVNGDGNANYNGVDGKYVVAEDGSLFTIGLTVANTYYEVTLNKDDFTCVVVKPVVTVTLNANGKAEVSPIEANINIVLVLPKLENAEFTFKGWFYDLECTKAVEEDFIPTEDVTLYAKWATKVIVNLVGVLEGDESTLVLGVDDVIGEYLPTYDVDVEGERIFGGWYLDAEFTNSLPEDAILTAEDSGISVYAKWNELPPYYGEYVGSEVYNVSGGNYGGKTLKIDAKGNMSGVKNGIIVSYDPETQKVTWKTSATSSTTDSFYFDERTGIIAGLYSSNTIGNDHYVFTKYQEDGKFAESYGVQAPITPGSSVTGYYARFVNVNTKIGQVNIFMYNNHIYSDIVIEDVAGNALTISQIKNSKTVVVRDATTNEIIIGLASIGDTFAKESKTKVLDAYFGTYQNGEETVVLDGIGGIVYGNKVGTYVKTADGVSYGFDVLLENSSEYYQLTLDGTTFTMVKPMVNIDFVVGDEHTPIESIQVNMNITVTLPDGADEGWVFNGWYLDQELTQKAPEVFTPTQDTTLYAKYSVPAVVTIVFNNGEDNQEVIYSVGDVTNIERPSYAKHIFEGWFTTNEFTEGTEWVSGNEIFENVTIYAKWSDAPIYNNTYLPVEIYNKDGMDTDVSRLTAWPSAIIKIDEYGHGSATGYPFRGEWDVVEYNPELGTLKLVGSGYGAGSIYNGYIDQVSGIIVVTKGSKADSTFDEVFMLTPFENTNSAINNVYSSYWNNGVTRAIEYIYDSNTYSIFVNDNQVYFNVSFKDVLGLPVKAVDAYKAPLLDVYDENGELIAKFGYNSTTGTMQELDGYQGSYTNTTAPNGLKGTLELNGIREAILNGKKGTYDLPEELEATYMFDVYIQGVYYEVSVDKETMTYTIVKPMVTLSFDAGNKASDMTITTNKYISISLPVLENPNFTFQGWYLDAEFTQKVTGDTYRPTASLTLFAKWSPVVKLNFVYNNGLDNVELDYTVGDELDMNEFKPENTYLNGMIFKGWYLDAECTVLFTGNTLEGETTLYALWIESNPYTITNKGNGSLASDTENLKYKFDEETNTWVSGNKGEASSKSIITIVALTDVTVTFQYAASSENASRWDYFHVNLNGKQQVNAGGSSTNLTFKEYSITLKEGDKLELIYEKDSSSDVGLDQAFIKDLTIAGIAIKEIA